MDKIIIIIIKKYINLLSKCVKKNIYFLMHKNMYK